MIHAEFVELGKYFQPPSSSAHVAVVNTESSSVMAVRLNMAPPSNLAVSAAIQLMVLVSSFILV